MKEKMSAYHQPLMLNPNKFPCETSLQINLFNFIALMGFLLFHAKNSKKTHSFLILITIHCVTIRFATIRFTTITSYALRPLRLLDLLDLFKFLAKRCFLLGFIVKWWNTIVVCLWMGVKACLQTTIRKNNTRHLQDGNNKYKLFFLFLSKEIIARNKTAKQLKQQNSMKQFKQLGEGRIKCLRAYGKLDVTDGLIICIMSPLGIEGIELT